MSDFNNAIGLGEPLILRDPPKLQNVRNKSYNPIRLGGSIAAPIPESNTGAYDIKGYSAKNGLPDQSKGQHLTDEYKLPNHITFSNQSRYHTDKLPGGSWTEAGKDMYLFTPSEHNYKYYTPKEYADYFSKYERKGTKVQLPDGSLVEGTR